MSPYDWETEDDVELGDWRITLATVIAFSALIALLVFTL